MHIKFFFSWLIDSWLIYNIFCIAHVDDERVQYILQQDESIFNNGRSDDDELIGEFIPLPFGKFLIIQLRRHHLSKKIQLTDNKYVLRNLSHSKEEEDESSFGDSNVSNVNQDSTINTPAINDEDIDENNNDGSDIKLDADNYDNDSIETVVISGE